MFKKIKIRLLIAIILSICAAVITNHYLNNINKKVSVVVAAKDIEVHALVRPDMLKEIQVNEDMKQTILKEAYTNKEDLIGSIARKKIKAGTPIIKNPEVLMFDEEKSLALSYGGKVDETYFIPYDKRIIGIEVDKTGAMNSLLKSGDYVDLIFTSDDESTGGIYSNMILQHIQIYKILERSQDQSNGPNSRKVIYLMASPDDCVKIAVAKRNGVIDLILNPMDGETGEIPPVHIYELIAEEPLTKEQKLNNLENYIRDEELTENSKKQLLETIDKERDKKTLVSIIQTSKITEDEKNKLLEILK